jgi:hypothetical protein
MDTAGRPVRATRSQPGYTFPVDPFDFIGDGEEFIDID